MFKANNNKSGQQELLSCCFRYLVSPNINKLWLLLCYVRVSFSRASPPGFHFNPHPEGEPCVYVFYKKGKRQKAIYRLLTAPQGGTQKYTLAFAYDSPR